jgi:uncharacterized membrane protein YciS (DUF1049 family)
MLYILPFAVIFMLSTIMGIVFAPGLVVITVAVLISTVWWVPLIMCTSGVLAREAFGSEEYVLEQRYH